jgi:nitric oxide reductase large subunit
MPNEAGRPQGWPPHPPASSTQPMRDQKLSEVTVRQFVSVVLLVVLLGVAVWFGVNVVRAGQEQQRQVDDLSQYTQCLREAGGSAEQLRACNDQYNP